VVAQTPGAKAGAGKGAPDGAKKRWQSGGNN